MSGLSAPNENVWQELQKEWGYPTIIGAHVELFHWSDGLRDLAKRLTETIPFLERDLARGDRSLRHEDVVYTESEVFLVATAADLLEQASNLSVRRFST